MKNKIYDLGQILVVLGSLFYGAELIFGERSEYNRVILAIYLVALALMLVGKIVGARKKQDAAQTCEPGQSE